MKIKIDKCPAKLCAVMREISPDKVVEGELTPMFHVEQPTPRSQGVISGTFQDFEFLMSEHFPWVRKYFQFRGTSKEQVESLTQAQKLEDFLQTRLMAFSEAQDQLPLEAPAPAESAPAPALEAPEQSTPAQSAPARMSPEERMNALVNELMSPAPLNVSKLKEIQQVARHAAVYRLTPGEQDGVSLPLQRHVTACALQVVPDDRRRAIPTSLWRVVVFLDVAAYAPTALLLRGGYPVRSHSAAQMVDYMQSVLVSLERMKARQGELDWGLADAISYLEGILHKNIARVGRPEVLPL